MLDEKSNPLLDPNLGKEYEILNEENSTFNTSIEDINKALDTKSVDDQENMSNLVIKLQNVKAHMERINEKIQFLKNFLQDDSPSNQLVLLNKIKIISDNISRRYELVNKKFTEKIANAKRKIELEISEKRTDSYGGGKVLQKLDARIKMDVDRLKERQEDLEKITKISYQLLELSRDMKKSAESQGRMVSSIEDHITIADTNVRGGNEQLNKRQATQSTNNKLYFWICSSLGFILLIGLFMLYWKYWRLKKTQGEA